MGRRRLEDYRHRGLAEPESVVVATDKYQLASDAVARFIEDECVTSSPVNKATTGKLFDAWERWRATDGTEPMSQKAFGQALDRHGYPVTSKARDGRWREGIALKPKVVDNAA